MEHQFNPDVICVENIYTREFWEEVQLTYPGNVYNYGLCTNSVIFKDHWNNLNIRPFIIKSGKEFLQQKNKEYEIKTGINWLFHTYNNICDDWLSTRSKNVAIRRDFIQYMIEKYS